MIARVATFNSLTGEEWIDNVKRRVAPATMQMTGNLGGFWLQDASTGKVISISSPLGIDSNGAAFLIT